MTARFHVDAGLLRAGGELSLPPGAARHVQVLRLQPGDAIVVFDGSGGEWDATVARMGRSEVSVRIGAHHAVDRELPVCVTLAFGMPANERLDALVEKATELGAARLEPLLCQRSVLRVEGERARRKRDHLQAVAVAACEQCGRTLVPPVMPVSGFGDAVAAWATDGAALFVLSLGAAARPWSQAVAPVVEAGRNLRFVSGPEGGLSEAEELALLGAGAVPVSLGPRTLRADTAPLMALAALAAMP
jgi:16S rRNA (uracil1498-N3)-methyltransferase